MARLHRQRPGDHRIDAGVARTSDRPLARGALTFTFAWTLLLLCLLTALLVVMELPAAGRELSLKLAVLALPPILLYPSAKRWFPFPRRCSPSVGLCGADHLAAAARIARGGLAARGCWLPPCLDLWL